MRNYNEQKRFLHLAIVATLLIFLYELGKILNVQAVLQNGWTLKLLVSSFFMVILIVSMVRFVKEQPAPLVIQIVGALGTFMLLVSTDPPATDSATETEQNFHTYKEGREEIVQLVLEGEIVKNKPQTSTVGMFTVPWGYMDDLYPRDFTGNVYSKEKHFFFFRISTSGFFDSLGVGTSEGFVYSSLNRPPTRQEFDNSGLIRHIEGPWYYLNSKPENFEKDCPTLCKN